MSSEIGLIVVSSLIFTWIIVSALVSEKAKAYGRSANKWFLITLFFGIFGIIMFLVVTSDETPVKESRDSEVPQESPRDERPKTDEEVSTE